MTEVIGRPSDTNETSQEDIIADLALLRAADEANGMTAYIGNVYADPEKTPNLYYLAAIRSVGDYYLKAPLLDHNHLPDPAAASEARDAYIHLLGQLRYELQSEDVTGLAIRRLVGTREELWLLTMLAHARAAGQNFVGLPTSTAEDFNGGRVAADIALFEQIGKRLVTQKLQATTRSR